ncbi:MAG: type II toxin-antitoxin system RelE/ParE family toxin [Bacteroidota bacterium]
MYKLIIQPEATEDMLESFEWYEKQKPGLGYEFLEEVEKGLSQLIINPLYFSSINTNLRRFKIKRFPFLIIYGIEKKNVAIVGVRHMSRKPKF